MCVIGGCYYLTSYPVSRSNRLLPSEPSIEVEPSCQSSCDVIANACRQPMSDFPKRVDDACRGFEGRKSPRSPGLA
jgi:hypothetical protein